MSSYDDPRWYEESEHNSTNLPSSPNYFRPLPPSKGLANTVFTSREVPTRQYYPGLYRRNRFSQFVLTITLLAIAFLGGWFSHQGITNTFIPSNQSQSYANLIQQAWTVVDQHYVDRKAVDYKEMSYQAIRAMLAVLHDKGHTYFLTPEELQAERRQISNNYTGIGIYLSQDPQTKQFLLPKRPISGSPAEKAGLKRGDIIIAINDVSTAGKDLNTVHTLLHGKLGKSEAITVQRPSTNQILTIRVTPAEFKAQNASLHYIAEDHIAHIQIAAFDDGVSDQLKDALNQAEKLGAKRIILDLRDDPGGLLQESINTASEFMGSGNVLLEQDSKGQRTPYAVNGNSVNTTIPIVVLVNNMTASAAEIVSGALQDNNRAIIIGTKTLGTGTVMNEFDLADGSAILLGVSEWLTPKGRFIRGQGITPNINVALSAGVIPLEPYDENTGHLTEQRILSSGDTQLVAAIHYLETHQTTSSGHSQGKVSQHQTIATGQLALEPAFFPVAA